jgi:hypothetical protein
MTQGAFLAAFFASLMTLFCHGIFFKGGACTSLKIAIFDNKKIFSMPKQFF